MGQKLVRGLYPLFGEGGWVLILHHKVTWAEAYLRAKYQLDPSSRLAAINMGRKFLGLRPLFGEEVAGFPSNTVVWAEATSVRSDILIYAAYGRNGYGPKIGGLCPFGGGGAGSPSNTVWPGLRPTCLPSFILIRQTV